MRNLQISKEFNKHQGRILRLRVLNSRFRGLWRDYIEILAELESERSPEKDNHILVELSESLEQEIAEILNRT